jgi:cell division septation protein DedD
LEQQAKQRLTGGVILVVLLVLLVPELLTGPRPPPQPTPVQPDQAPMRSYTMDLGESVHANSAPVAASTTVPSIPASAPAPEATPPRTASVASAPTPRPPTQTAAPAAATAPLARAPAAAPTHAAPADKSSEHSAAIWTVQLGTFSSRENAAHLVTSLKSHGFSASIAESTKSGHKLYRVRVGAERDRASAQKLLARLKAAGEKGADIVPR